MIVVEKAYKFRIYPNKNQEELINKTFGCCRFIYNRYLAKRIELYENNKETYSYKQCSSDLTHLKKELVWLKLEINKYQKEEYLMQLYLKSLVENIMFHYAVQMQKLRNLKMLISILDQIQELKNFVLQAMVKLLKIQSI